jgi:hypothetical protein
MTATLTEQLGAMSIIDALRLQHLRIEDHLDLPRRRAEIAARIREYYAAQNIAVDDSTIDAGVRQYFADRLTWAPPQFGGPVARKVADLFITRDKWAPVVLHGGALVGTVLATVLVVTFGLHQYQDRLAHEDLAATTEAYERTQARLATLEGEMVTLRQTQITYARTALTSTLTAAAGVIAECKSLAAAGVHSTAEIPARIRETATANAALGACAESVEQTLAAGRALAQTDQRLAAIEKGDLYAQYQAARPVQKNFVEARTALRVGSSSSAAAVDAAQAALRQMAGVQAATAELATVTAKFKELPMPADDRKTVDSLIETTGAAVEQGDATAVSATLKRLDALYRVANADLTLNIVSRAGVQSGVRRTFSKSGGNAWYLIVEPTTPSGEVVPVAVANSETGATAIVKSYGVRVSEAEFNKVRAEKMQDGHVHDRRMGNKPRGHLSFTFVRPVLAETITAW